jgi:hypothetical protein
VDGDLLRVHEALLDLLHSTVEFIEHVSSCAACCPGVIARRTRRHRAGWAETVFHSGAGPTQGTTRVAHHRVGAVIQTQGCRNTSARSAEMSRVSSGSSSGRPLTHKGARLNVSRSVSVDMWLVSGAPHPRSLVARYGLLANAAVGLKRMAHGGLQIGDWRSSVTHQRVHKLFFDQTHFVFW